VDNEISIVEIVDRKFVNFNGMDILLEILRSMTAAHPNSNFEKSLYHQYCNRGGLSKKQLEGLRDKAIKSNTLTQGRLATLEAIIKKKPTRERAAASITAIQPIKDVAIGNMIERILKKYPEHKRVLFLKSKFDNNEIISTLEKSELGKFAKMLLK